MKVSGEFNAGYGICGTIDATNFADATTYYSGGLDAAWTTIAAIRRQPMPRAGVLKKISFYIRIGGVAGTSENSSLYIRINNTTDYLLDSALKFDADNIQIYSPNINVNQGDYFEFKLITPTWVTNPTSVYNQFNSAIE